MSRSFAHSLRAISARRLAKVRSRKPRLLVESLEDRRVPAQYVVTSALGDNSPGTLGEKIGIANGNPGADTIVFDTTGTFATAQTITLSAPLPAISDPLTITGTGVNNLTVDGANTFQVFNTSFQTVTLSNFTVTQGNATSGGGLSGSGFITLDHMVFSNNQAAGPGGAIRIGSGGFLHVQSSTISGNTSTFGGDPYYDPPANGGGIYFFSGGSLLLESSTITGNKTVNSSGFLGGGGLYFFGTPSNAPPSGFVPGTLVIRNSTIEGNSSDGTGGGIMLKFGGGTLEISNSTITGNTSTASGASYYGGGGIGVYYSNMAIVLNNSIVAGNSNSTAPDILSTSSVTANFSAIGSTTGSSPVLDAASAALVGVNLNLDSGLADNGGPTKTVKPLTGSVLINGGSSALVAGIPWDQRGPGYRRSYGANADIGAVEVQPPGMPFALANVSNVLTPGGTTYTFTVDFLDVTGSNQGIKASTLNNHSDVIRVSDGGAFNVLAQFVSIDSTSNGPTRTVTYSFTPPGGSWNNADDAIFSVSVEPNIVSDIDGNFVTAEVVGSFNVVIPPFNVTNANDSGPGSLRNAITFANISPLDDVITFDPAFFSTPQTIALQSPLPTLLANAGNVAIVGTTPANVIVDAGGAFRVLDSKAPSLSLSGFTITGGLAADPTGAPNGEFGGGLRASGSVTLDNMVIRDNKATGPGGFFDSGAGAGIGMLAGAFLLVRNSTIADNVADEHGGGIFMRFGGGLQIENSTISGNSANSSGPVYGIYGGGAISFLGSPTTTPYPGFTPGAVVIANSTIVDNTTTGSGAAVAFTFRFAGNFLLQGSTVTGNTALANGVSSYFGNTYGGGAFFVGIQSSGTMTLQNSVVSGNVNTTSPDIQTPYAVTASFSALGSTAGIGAATLDPASTALVGVALTFGPLQDNGGPTPTMEPAGGSPLIDGGSNALLPAGSHFDQRGYGYLRSFIGVTDIGAFEVQPLGLPFGIADTTDVTAPGATTYTFTVTFDDATGTNRGLTAATFVNNDTLVHVTDHAGFDVAAHFESIDVNADGTPRTITYSFTPPGGDWDFNDSGYYSVMIQSSTAVDFDSNPVIANEAGTFRVIIPPFVVKNANDSGPGSLRSAILLANSTPTDDGITFDPAFFSTPRTITLQTPLPAFTPAGGSISITGGADPDNIIVDAGGQFRVFDSSAPLITLSGFTVKGGLATNDIGGGLKVNGTAVLDHMVFTGNSATGGTNLVAGQGGGGAIGLTQFSGQLKVVDSTISGNTATITGGGIFVWYSGALEIENSTISGNTTTFTGTYAGFVGGGGIFISGYATNYPTYGLGFTPGAFIIRNSTIANNTSAGSGGGIMGNRMRGQLILQNSTVSGNSAAAPDSFTRTSTYYPYGSYTYYYGGGGAGFVFGNPTLTLQNSIISGNTNPAFNDISNKNAGYGGFGYTNAYYSAIGDAVGFTLGGDVGNVTPGTPLNLSPLGDFGGPTQTMIPQAGSPLIDGGSNALIPGGVTTDQRGQDRTFPVGGNVDIGAVELHPALPTIVVDPAQVNPTNSQLQVVFDVNFDQDVTGFDSSQIDFTGSTATGFLVANVVGTGSTYTVTVTGMTSDGDVVATVLAGTGTQGLNAGGQNNLPSLGSATISIDTAAPTVTIEQDALQVDPATAGPIVFDVTFNEPVTGFTDSDIVFTGSVGGTPVASVAQTGVMTYTISVTGMSGEGSVIPTLPAGAVFDAANNGNAASTSVDNDVRFDNVAPTVTINKGATQLDPTQVGTIVFDVLFSEPVTGFTAADVDLTASTATAAGGFVVNVSGTGPAYTVTVSGVTGRGDVIATIPAAAVIDVVGHPSAASTSTDNTVAFLHAGAIEFSQATYNYDEDTGTGSVTITMIRTGGSEGIVSANYVAAVGTAHAADFGTPSGTGSFTWGEGDTTPRTFTIPIVNDSKNEGKETFDVKVQSPTGGAILGTNAVAKVVIAPSDGDVIDGTAKKPFATMSDADGDVVKVTLGGKVGKATVYRTDTDGDNMGPIELIVLTGTDSAKSTLSIQTAKPKGGGAGDLRVNIDEIKGTGLKGITAKKSDLTGAGINLSSFLGSLTIGDIRNGADITLTGAPPAKPKSPGTKLTVGQIFDNTDIAITGAALANLKAIAVGDGTITAPYVGTISVTGKAKTKNAIAIPGDFNSDLTITGVGVPEKTLALKSLTAKGTATNIKIAVGGLAGTVGDVGKVSFGSFLNSRLFAGYSGLDDGSTPFNLSSTIGSFTVTGKDKAFAKSYVIASNILGASLKSADTANGGTKFGFVFNSTFKKLTVGTPKLKYDAKLGGTQVLQADLQVKKV
jgi:parallel beta-helix repeat protein